MQASPLMPAFAAQLPAVDMERPVKSWRDVIFTFLYPIVLFFLDIG